MGPIKPKLMGAKQPLCYLSQCVIQIQGILTLSPLDDTMLNILHMPGILFYPPIPRTDVKDKDPVKVIKNALAEALVDYYPFAGRLKEVSDGRLVVDCTAEGVGFVEADAEITLEEFGEQPLEPPFPCIQELVYIPTGILGGPIFAMQVTRLLCGGFILSFSCNHVMSDEKGVVQFVSHIANIASGAREASLVLVWKRELLTVRDPPCVTCTTLIKKFSYFFQEEAYGKDDDTTEEVEYKSVFMGQKELDALRIHLPNHLRESCSTFDLIAASMFRSRTIALQPHPEEEVRLVFMVDSRRSLALPNGFYGNANLPATFVFRAGKDDRVVGSFGYFVEQVKKAKEEIKEEYVRSYIDIMAMGVLDRLAQLLPREQ